MTYAWQRAFSYSAPTLWNPLRKNFEKTTSLSSFKTALKTFLLRKTFELLLNDFICLVIYSLLFYDIVSALRFLNAQIKNIFTNIIIIIIIIIIQVTVL